MQVFSLESPGHLQGRFRESVTLSSIVMGCFKKERPLMTPQISVETVDGITFPNGYSNSPNGHTNGHTSSNGSTTTLASSGNGLSNGHSSPPRSPSKGHLSSNGHPLSWNGHAPSMSSGTGKRISTLRKGQHPSGGSLKVGLYV